jgi:hypothetical protein
LKLALMTAVAVALAAVAVAVVVVLRQQTDIASIADLDRGDCVDAAAFLDGGQPAREDLERADCDDPHDAEVLMLVELDAGQAAAYEPVVPDPVCVEALDDQADVTIVDERLLVAGVADASGPTSGQSLACFGFSADGEKLDGRATTR